MVERLKTGRGGSVIFLVVTAICLTLSLCGVVYYLKTRSSQSEKTQVISTKIDNNDSNDTLTEALSGDASETDSTTSDDTPASTSENGEDLPTTGPNQSFVDMIGVFLLTYFAINYASSKKYLPRSL